MKTLLITVAIFSFSLAFAQSDSITTEWEFVGNYSAIPENTTWEEGTFYGVNDSVLIPSVYVAIKVQYRKDPLGTTQRRFRYYLK